jgi:putative ABC transport system permease protein
MFRRRRRPQDDFSAELRAHLELESDRLRGEGMSEEDAYWLARKNLGNLMRAQEHFFETNRWVWLEQLWQDLRLGFRRLRKSPAFSGSVFSRWRWESAQPLPSLRWCMRFC